MQRQAEMDGSEDGKRPGVEIPTGTVASRTYWQTVRVRLSRDPVTIVCASILLLIILVAIFAPFLAPKDPEAGSVFKRLAKIGSPGYPLGADELGRDMLSRLIYGGRVSLFMGIAPVAGAVLIGGTLGIVAGFIGGKTNMVIMRVMDVFYAFPSVLLAIAISGAMGPVVLTPRSATFSAFSGCFTVSCTAVPS